MSDGTPISRGRPAKLSREIVADIRAWHAAMKAMPTAHEMAAKHRVHVNTVYAIAREQIHKESWAARRSRAYRSGNPDAVETAVAAGGD
jgi:hypothetical protein